MSKFKVSETVSFHGTVQSEDEIAFHRKRIYQERDRVQNGWCFSWRAVSYSSTRQHIMVTEKQSAHSYQHTTYWVSIARSKEENHPKWNQKSINIGESKVEPEVIEHEELSEWPCTVVCASTCSREHCWLACTHFNIQFNMGSVEIMASQSIPTIWISSWTASPRVGMPQTQNVGTPLN